MIINHEHTLITSVHYDRKTFLEQATDLIWTWGCITILDFIQNLQNGARARVLLYIRLERLASDKHIFSL